jgi:hypothetical protein
MLDPHPTVAELLCDRRRGLDLQAEGKLRERSSAPGVLLCKVTRHLDYNVITNPWSRLLLLGKEFAPDGRNHDQSSKCAFHVSLLLTVIKGIACTTKSSHREGTRA